MTTPSLPLHRRMQQQLAAVLHDEREARAIVMLLLERLGGLSVADVLCGRDDELPAEQQACLQKAAGRVAAGEPVQYVVGWEWFCGLRIGVAPGVLIPRPETEELVQRAARALRHAGSAPAVLDIGTGSGCIALALKHIVPEAQVEAWDIAPDALAIAQRNAEALRLDIRFAEQDILRPDLPERLRPAFNLVVSNPPYVCRSEAQDMERHVLDHEPHRALFVPDDDPLVFYRAIARAARHLLLPDGWLMVEVNRRFAREVAEVFSESGLTEAAVYDDEFGNARFVGCRQTNV